jgi:hypothetical protein
MIYSQTLKSLPDQDTKSKVMDTTDLNTDHQGLIAHLPYTALGQLPLPKPKSPQDHPPAPTLITPMKREHKQALTEAITDQLHPQITDLWTRLNQIMEDQVNPHWTKLDNGLTTVTAPKWAPRPTFKRWSTL